MSGRQLYLLPYIMRLIHEQLTRAEYLSVKQYHKIYLQDFYISHTHTHARTLQQKQLLEHSYELGVAHVVRPEFGMFSKCSLDIPAPARALRPEGSRHGYHGLPGQLSHGGGNLALLTHGDLQVRDIVLGELAEVSTTGETQVMEIGDSLFGELVLGCHLFECRGFLYLVVVCGYWDHAAAALGYNK